MTACSSCVGLLEQHLFYAILQTPVSSASPVQLISLAARLLPHFHRPVPHPAAATWPGLVEVYLRHLEGELERGVATSTNAAMRLFKKLMAAAEDGSRTGEAGRGGSCARTYHVADLLAHPLIQHTQPGHRCCCTAIHSLDCMCCGASSMLTPGARKLCTYDKNNTNAVGSGFVGLLAAGRPSCCLLRRAARLFEFIHKAVAGSQDGDQAPLAPLTGSHGQELSQLLLKQLLPNTAYCQCSNAVVFSGAECGLAEGWGGGGEGHALLAANGC